MKELNENIIFLQKKISELETENELLKSLLEEAKINYKKEIDHKIHNRISYDDVNNQSIQEIKIDEKLANLFFSKFWGRQDVYAKRYYNNKTGKSGYFPQCNNFWKDGCCKKHSGLCKNCELKSYKTLKIENIIEHLKGNSIDGNDVIGIYPLLKDSTSRLLVFDFDNHNENGDVMWQEEVDSLRKICILNDIDPLVERSRSGNGAHVWIFFNKPINAIIIRKFAYSLLEKGAEQINLKCYKYYDRILPNQDIIDENGLGNLIALPLQGQAVKNNNSVFVDENWKPYLNQVEALLSKPKLSQDFIEEKIKLWNHSNIYGFSDNNRDGLEPWKQIKLNDDDIQGALKIVLANGIFVDTINITPRFQNMIRRMAAFSNPVFYKNKAIGISNYKTDRIIYLGQDHINGYIEIPRGLKEQLIAFCKEANIEYEIVDDHVKGSKIDLTFKGMLYEEQKKGLSELSKFDNGILNATTAFGKTVVCSALIAEKKVNTLIILESSSLIAQWKNALENFLDINAPLTTYTTKTGRIKQRVEIIGILHGQKDTTGGKIDIAMVGSLYKKGDFFERINDYGMVIVDECHHVASDTMLKVLQKIKSKYVYGITATQIRSDQLEKINTMIIGPIRYKYSTKDRNTSMGVRHYIYPRFTTAVLKRSFDTNVHPNEAYETIINNDNRNAQIIYDIKECINNGRTPIILSKYKEHCEKLYNEVKNYAKHVILLTGNNSRKENAKLFEKLKEISNDESVIIIGTGSMIGEGFDYPRLDTLIMATPISLKGLVEQYAGRLNRNFEGKNKIIIYDYVDSHINIFSNMYSKRLKAYKQMGYTVFSKACEDISNSNYIFDSGDFWESFIKDLRNAKNNVVISSPYISNEKIDCLINCIKELKLANVNIVVVTLNPDEYLFGEPAYWMRLHDELRNVGVRVQLTDLEHEKYAIIDDNIVWFGSINILGKDKLEEQIMRIVDKSIVSELEFRTFNGNRNLEEKN